VIEGKDAGDHGGASESTPWFDRHLECRRAPRSRPPLSLLIYTAPARVGGRSEASASKTSRHDGNQYVLRFFEKGGKSRENSGFDTIWKRFILEYIEAAGNRR